ncbi:MAG: serine--tRNA ligase [Nannocystaceae bacterium]|nr:serine--tRNA ligase [Nannocystaceae bacterium]
MLDIKLLRETPDAVVDNLEARRVVVFDDLTPDRPGWARLSVDRLVALDVAWREALAATEEVRRRQNANAEAMKAVGKLPKDEQAAARAPLLEEGRALREAEREQTAAVQAAEAARDAVWAKLPNTTHPEVPRGHTDDDHRVLRQVGTIRDFAAEGFEPLDHVELCERLELCDLASGAKVAGQKFYYLKNDAVLLDLALQHYALDVAARHGFTLHTTPDLARIEILAGLGFNPRGAGTQVYSIADSDLCLVGTAEITLGGMLADEIIDEERLPLLVAGLSHCFRTEAGAAGRDTRGLYRVHQFTKVELFAFVTGELAVSEAMHARFLAIEEEIFTGLGLPYRVLDIASGDLGGPAFRKFDIEAWMPGRAAGQGRGAYGEVTSTSNCTDYQARRLRIRYRPRDDGSGKARKPRFVHMLNGTAIANTRAIVALLENYQQRDGSIAVPQALQRWVGKDRIGPRTSAP